MCAAATRMEAAKPSACCAVARSTWPGVRPRYRVSWLSDTPGLCSCKPAMSQLYLDRGGQHCRNPRSYTTRSQLGLELRAAQFSTNDVGELDGEL